MRSEASVHIDMYYMEASGPSSSLTGGQIQQPAAFLNCGCASALTLIPISLQRSTARQLSSMILLKDLVVPFFFPSKIQRK